jgi:predicted transposase YbfD/YdcC
VDWPGCEQVCRIQRVRSIITTDEVTVETVYAVTSLGSAEASADALLVLNRGHWGIENGLHYVRDVTMHEDASQVGKDNGPLAMAAVRNTAISTLHKHGIHKIAAALREFSADVGAALAFVGLAWLSH